MKKINGKCTSAVIFADDADDYAVAQIKMLCNNETLTGCMIRIMPDVHPGKVGTIGLTMTIGNKIMPNLVGIDIGCGVTLATLRAKRIELQKLDTVIRNTIPSGYHIRDKAHYYSLDFPFDKLHCFCHINKEKAELSLGTLGSGNHFIEIDKGRDNTYYLSVHSGSRRLGKEVTDYYLTKGHMALKKQGMNIPYELTYLDGELMEHYLHDLAIVQDFAALNRDTMINLITKAMKWKVMDTLSCCHNYVDFLKSNKNSAEHILHTTDIPQKGSKHQMILRKGAICAQKDETVIIPVNMRDGILLGRGLGNPDWNFSAPHGAGRIMNRETVRKQFTVSAFKSEMKGIYCSCISADTLDEAPFAYRTIDDIKTYINDTVEITEVLKPVYNFKAGTY